MFVIVHTFVFFPFILFIELFVWLYFSRNLFLFTTLGKVTIGVFGAWEGFMLVFEVSIGPMVDLGIPRTRFSFVFCTSIFYFCFQLFSAFLLVLTKFAQSAWVGP